MPEIPKNTSCKCDDVAVLFREVVVFSFGAATAVKGTHTTATMTTGDEQAKWQQHS